MITLTAEIICDTCKQVVASVGPQDTNITKLLYALDDKARARGAIVGIGRTICADCHAKSTTPTVWVIEESK